MRVIHNGVDWQLFRSTAPYEHPKPYIAAVGQLVPHKGFDLLVNAFGDVAERFPNVDLLIAGDGESRAELMALARRRNVVNRVRFLGIVDEWVVAALMAGSRFVAVPSRREPFGIVALEGMAAGKPVIATPVGGIPEFVKPPCNRLVEPNLGAWSEALLEWLTLDSAGQLKGCDNAARARQYGWNHVAERYLAAYAQACDNGAAIG